MSFETNFKETEIGMIPDDWEVSTLDEISLKVTDGSHFSPKESATGDKIIATVKDMEYNQFSFKNCKTISDEDFNLLVKNGCSPEKGDILISKDGANCLDLIFVYNQDKKIVLLSSIAIVKLRKDFNPQFYRYYLLSPVAQKIMRDGYVSGSAIPRVILKDFKKVPIPILPNIETQNKIADILNSLDNKIALNRSMNSTLEAIGQALFKRWFVDFEFPDEEGKPYRSSGGEMVETGFGEVPRGWRVGTLGDIIENFDSKRIPLSSRERALKKGIYPYYGAASIMDYVEDYIFDGIYILMGEDGTVIDENEHPILQYAWGKFWVNNHAHVIQGKNGIPTEYVLLLLKKMNIKHLITGAVQPKINQGNMNRLIVIIPPKEPLNSFSKLITPLFEKYRVSSEEVKSLSVIRDALLPKLMSGEIRVSTNSNLNNENK